MRTFSKDVPTTGGDSGTVVTEEQLKSVWGTISDKFKSLAALHNGKGANEAKSQLMFEIMNEPHQMHQGLQGIKTVLDYSNAAIKTIRDKGINNLVIIEGDYWSGLWSWTTDASEGNKNSSTFTTGGIVDTDKNYAIAIHQYFYTNPPNKYQGLKSTCMDEAIFKSDLKFAEFKTYANKNHIKLFLDEFGVPSVPTNPSICSADLTDTLNDLLSFSTTQSGDDAGFLDTTTWVVSHAWDGKPNAITPENWKTNYKVLIKKFSKHTVR